MAPAVSMSMEGATRKQWDALSSNEPWMTGSRFEKLHRYLAFETSSIVIQIEMHIRLWLLYGLSSSSSLLLLLLLHDVPYYYFPCELNRYLTGRSKWISLVQSVKTEADSRVMSSIMSQL